MTLSARNAPAVQLLAAPPKGNGDDRRQWRRSCWGRGQQDANGVKQTLGAATR